MGRGGGGSGGGHVSHNSSSGHRVGTSSGGHRAPSKPSSSHTSYSRPSSGPSYSRPHPRPGYTPPPPHHGPGYSPPPPRVHVTMGGPPPPPPIHRRRYVYGGVTYYDSLPFRIQLSRVMKFVAWFILFVAIVTAIANISDRADHPSTSISRTRLEDPPAFDNDCVIDETGEFSNRTRLAKNLKYFYDETGVQPFIIWKDYDPNLKTDTDKRNWAEEYYAANLRNNTYLYVYFEEQYDNGDGFMCYVNGPQSASIMDAEAVEIFWNYIDRYWQSSMSSDTLFQKVFTTTVDIIMAKPTNAFDVLMPVIWCAVIVVILRTIAYVLKVQAQKKHQEAEDTQRILNTPITPIGGGSTDAATEAAISKYSDDI